MTRFESVWMLTDRSVLTQKASTVPRHEGVWGYRGVIREGVQIQVQEQEQTHARERESDIGRAPNMKYLVHFGLGVGVFITD